MEKEYYFRDITQTDWEKFHEMDLQIFPDEPMNKNSLISGISGLNALTVIMVDKETKNFIGYYRNAVYGNLGHITRIGVHPDYRRKGYGSKLLEKSMFYLEKAGCKKYYLYVLEKNEEAKKLYEKYGFTTETKSFQYFVPKEHLVEKPRGRCRHVDWGEIQMISLRFNLNPYQIQNYFSREDQYILVYEMLGQQIGFCRFSPNFPGAMPFILKDPEYVADFVTILHDYITDKKLGNVRITFDGQERLVQKLAEEKIPINYELLRMSRPAKLD